MSSFPVQPPVFVRRTAGEHYASGFAGTLYEPDRLFARLCDEVRSVLQRLVFASVSTSLSGLVLIADFATNLRSLVLLRNVTYTRSSTSQYRVHASKFTFGLGSA